MDKIEKYLRSLPAKLRLILEKEIIAIFSGKLDSKDVKPLAGKKGYFRVRKGVFRIVFRKENDTISLVKVEKRSDTTYNL